MQNPYVTVTFTFIRHGESTDNLKSLWAGWRDYTLESWSKGELVTSDARSRLMESITQQAEALGASFSNTNLTTIYSSPLKRALMTAEILHNLQSDPKPPIETSLLLREQHYGLGEGQRYDIRREPGLSLADHFTKGKFPPLRGRTERFPEGESLEDVAARAEEAVEQFAVPCVLKAAREGTDGIHIAFVSHGMFIWEAIAALMRRGKHNAEGIDARDYRGLRNTGWTRVTVQIRKNESLGDDVMNIQVSARNICNHLDNLVRQKGGIGSAAYDPKQKDIRAFFKQN